MKSSVEKLSETRVKLTVNVPFDELKSEIDQAYKAIAQQVSIPGFRKGKAPRQLIDARFGRGPILEQVVNDMLPNRYERAVNDNDLKVIGQPSVDITKIEDNDHVEFTAEVDVRPEIDVPDFSEFSVTVPPLEVGEDAVEESLTKLRERFAELKDTDRELKNGDVAVINLRGEVDGEEISALTTDGLHYTVGSDDLVKGLDDALDGLKAGEDAEFTAELQAGEHQGEEAAITVHVEATKESILPELDEEFVQMASEFDTVEELRESTKTEVEEAKKTEQAAAIRDEVLKLALEKATFELPAAIVEEQAHAQVHQIVGELAHNDAALNSILEAQGITREDFDAEQRANAENAVRTQLFLDALAEQEQPEVSQQELTDHILFTAQSYGMDPNQFVQQLTQSGQIANLFADVRRGKALAAAICRVTVTDTNGNSVDPAEFFGDDADEADSAGAADAAEANSPVEAAVSEAEGAENVENAENAEESDK